MFNYNYTNQNRTSSQSYSNSRQSFNPNRDSNIQYQNVQAQPQQNQQQLQQQSQARKSNMQKLQTSSKLNPDPSQYKGAGIEQKMKVLGRVKYKNQLAQLQYQQKITQLHTKYSSKSKQSVQKKLRARNQIADFIDEQQQQFGQQFEELMDYKYGASKWKNFHYERQSSNQQFTFCSLCDQIHKQTQQQHQNICKYEQLMRSPRYYIQSIDRIVNSLTRLSSQQSQQLSTLAKRIKKSENVSRQLLDLMPVLRNDQILGKIAAKLQQVIQNTQ